MNVVPWQGAEGPAAPLGGSCGHFSPTLASFTALVLRSGDLIHRQPRPGAAKRLRGHERRSLPGGA